MYLRRPRSSRHIALLASLHRFTSKRGTTRSQVLLKCWRFFLGGGGEGSPSSFLSIIIQKQRASKTAFYASYNLSANLQQQTGNSFFFLAGCKLALYSGILALGIGDTMASIVGKSLGRFRWPGKACLKSCSVLNCHCCMRCVKRNFHLCWGRAWRDWVGVASNGTSGELTQQDGRAENGKTLVYDKRDRAITYNFCRDLY